MINKLEKINERYNELAELIVNPEVIADNKTYTKLAKEYSTRIVNLKDGHIIDDTMPFDGKEEKIAECEFTKTNAYTNSIGVEFTVKVPNVKCGRFTLIIRSENDKALSEQYELFIR